MKATPSLEQYENFLKTNWQRIVVLAFTEVSDLMSWDSPSCVTFEECMDKFRKGRAEHGDSWAALNLNEERKKEVIDLLNYTAMELYEK